MDWRHVAAVVALTPLSIWLNASELKLCARATGGDMPLGRALAHSSTATVANLLPVPASVLIRGAALMRSGASLAASSQIILAAGLLWFAIAAAVSALAITRNAGGISVAVGFLLVVILISEWIRRRSSAPVAAGFVVVRAAMLAVMVVRLYFCFAAIDRPLPVADAAVYTLASIVGSAVAVVPAGLGVAEGIAALIAQVAGGSPAAAFLSLGLNRIIGLFGSAVTALWFALASSRRAQPDAD